VTVDLTSVDEKVKRSKEHIDELQRRIDAFEQREPYKLVEQSNPDAPDHIQGILRILKPIPPCIPVVVGDAMHSLRSALDHLVCSAVGVNITKDTAFPIWRKPTPPVSHDYKALVKGKANGAPKAFLNLLYALQPYQGGKHEALWAVDYLDITDKHRLLIDAPAAIAKIFQWAGPAALGIKPDRQYPLHDGYMLWEVPTEEPKKPDVAIEIALGEPKILVGEPLVPTLTDLIETTTAVIDQLRTVL
jgi:hypothetical protein